MAIAIGTVTAKSLISKAAYAKAIRNEQELDNEYRFLSKWHLLPDIQWTGEDKEACGTRNAAW